jgi:hypothetical protein
MLTITDYYRFQKGTGKTRFDEIASTQQYLPLNQLRNKDGKLFIYFTPYQKHNAMANPARLPDYQISKQSSISGVFGLSPNSYFGYGDVRGTQDAILFIFNEDLSCMEVFIARGQKGNKQNLYTLLLEGELDEEVRNIRERGKAC